MTQRYFIIFLGCFLVSLMSSPVFATYAWMQADGTTPQYAATDNWMEPNQWDSTGAHTPPSVAPGVPPLTAASELKVVTNTWMTGPAHCTVNSAVGSYTTQNTSVNGTLYVNGNANIGFNRTGSKNGLRVGSNSAGGTLNGYTGTVDQSAGTVTATNVYLGYAGSNGNLSASGNYIISGGTLTCSLSLSVGTGINGSGLQTTAGKFTVDGNSSTISVTALRVGGTDAPTTTNSGTLEFKLNDGSGVSSIGCTSVNLDAGGANATTALIVSVLGANPVGDILLVNNTGTAVGGFFDTANGGSAAEGASVIVGTKSYRLTYMYDAVSKTVGAARSAIYNDIALVPEPATIALLGLGLLAIRRKK